MSTQAMQPTPSSPATSATSSNNAPSPGVTLLIAPPFLGHLNILIAYANKLQELRPLLKLEFIICGWQDTLFHDNLLERTPIHVPRHVLRALVPLTSSSSMTFNHDRAQHTLKVLQAFIEERYCSITNTGGRPRPLAVQRIIYDFFMLDAAVLARKWRIPSMCSIPAVLHSDEALSKAQGDLQKFLWTEEARHNPLLLEYGDRLVPISDSYGLLGDVNLVWSTPALYEGQDLGALRDAIFLPDPAQPTTSAALISAHSPPQPFSNEAEVVYINLGAVITGNLVHQDPLLLDDLMSLYTILIEVILSSSKAYRVHLGIPNQGTACLAHVKAQPWWSRVGHRIKVQDWVPDQAAILQDPKTCLFISHGGGNSFREALTARKPLFILPFFGDQFNTARLVHLAGIGRTPNPFLLHDSVDTASNRDIAAAFLGSGGRQALKSQLQELLMDLPTYTLAMSHFADRHHKLVESWGQHVERIFKGADNVSDEDSDNSLPTSHTQ